MKALAVLRIGKIKSWGQVGGAGEHNSRRRETLNADPEALTLNRYLVGSPDDDLVVICQKRLAGQKIRSNAVLAVDGIMSASPEYFRPGRPEAYGRFDQKRLDDWVAASQGWLDQKYGDRVISSVLHLDEATPHIQFLLLPLDDKGKLNCRGLFGGTRQTLTDLQTDYAKAVAHLGIERGLAGSKAKHQEIAKYYSATQNIAGLAVPAVPAPGDFQTPEVPGKMARLSDHTLREFAREAAEKALNQQTSQVAPLLKTLAAENAFLKKEKGDLKKSNARLTRENDFYKAEADRLRDLDLAAVLTSMFGARESADSRPGYKSRKFDLPDGGNIGVTGRLWKDNKSPIGGKGAINLVMHLSGYGQDQYRQAVRDLAELFGERDLVRSLAHHLVEQAPREAVRIQREKFQMPAPHEFKWPVVREYLVKERKLPEALIEQMHEAGLLFSDQRGNCVFPRDQASGVFKRGSGHLPFKQTLGREGLPYVLPGSDDSVYITEAPIDALTLKAMHPDSTILATGGHMPFERLKAYLDKPKVFLAQDNDRSGHDQAKAIATHCPKAKRLTPDQGKDWNEFRQLMIKEEERKRAAENAEALRPTRLDRNRSRGPGFGR